LSRTPNSTLTSDLYEEASTLISTLSNIFLSQALCGREPFNFPEVFPPEEVLTMTLQRGTLAQESLSIPSTQSGPSFTFPPTLDYCVCASSFTLDNQVLAFIPLPAPANRTRENVVDAAEAVGSVSGFFFFSIIFSRLFLFIHHAFFTEIRKTPFHWPILQLGAIRFTPKLQLPHLEIVQVPKWVMKT